MFFDILILEKSRFPRKKQFFDINYWKSAKTCQLFCRTLLKNYIVSLAHQFRHFAIQHQRFVTLSKSDQRKLLGRNSSLYIQVNTID